MMDKDKYAPSFTLQLQMISQSTLRRPQVNHLPSLLRIFSFCLTLLFLTSGCVANKETSSTLQGVQPPPPPPDHTKKVTSQKPYYFALSDLTDAFCTDLLKKLGPQAIYLDRGAIKDVTTGDMANFSRYLEQELDSSCSKKGFTHVYDPGEADYLLGAVFQRYRQDMRVFFKFHSTDSTIRKSLDYQISQDRLPKDSFKENLKHKAYILAQQFGADQANRRIYIKPVVEGTQLYVSDFSKAFTERIKGELIRSYKGITIIDEKVIKETLSSTDDLKKKVKNVKNLAESDAELTNADTILAGKYFIEGEIVVIHMNMNSLDGRILNSAEVEIKKKYIYSRLKNIKNEKLASLADIKTEKIQSQVSISTNKGGDYPVYHNDEKIIFHMQVAKPLYVYLYNINSRGEVVMLFPFTRNSRQQKLIPGYLYTIPSENDDYEMVVEPPFGVDAVKIFASTQRIPIPEFSTRIASRGYTSSGTRAIGVRRKNAQEGLAYTTRINPRDLVDYYRGKAAGMGIEIFEDSFLLETTR